MNWPAKTQFVLCLVLFALVTKKVSCNSEKESTAFTKPQTNEQWDDSQAAMQEILRQAEKRGSWKNFQGSWGKREDSDQLKTVADFENEQFKRGGGWSNLHGTWGKRDSEIYPDVENIPRKLFYDANFKPDETMDSAESYGMSPLKRTWTNFAGTWGKRPYTGPNRAISPRSNNWSSLRGSWGKRGGDWSALRGAWGKRSLST